MKRITVNAPWGLPWKHPPTSRQAVKKEHAVCLAEMLDRPTRYGERCVDQVSFLPVGGQQWVRTLQTQIPVNALPTGSDWRIVSLAKFDRWRFPDFTITDENGQCLNRLTRGQHGIALTKALLATHFFALPKKLQDRLKKDDKAKDAYEILRDRLYALLTSVKKFDDNELQDIVAEFIHLFADLLISVGLARDLDEQETLHKRLETFAYDLASNATVIQYLCWVKAEPGKIVNLRVSWTMRDPLVSLNSRDTLRKALPKILAGLSPNTETRRDAWMRGYLQFGLRPSPYAFRTPQTGSYYFILEPPAKCDVAFMDWEASNSIQDDELNSAYASAHLHDRDTTKHQTNSPAVRAYVRCRTREHKQIAAGALLNAIFAFFVAHGKFTNNIGTSAQIWLLLTPTLFVTYLAEQQRHYYAHTTRRQRGILWAYLALSIIFLVTISVSLAHGTTNSAQWNGWTQWVTWIFIAISTAVCVWYTPLGYNYVLAIDKWTRDKLPYKGGHRPKVSLGPLKCYEDVPDIPVWKIYREAIRKYCNWVIRAMLLATTVVMAVVILTWRWPPYHKGQHVAGRPFVYHGTLTLTTWPVSECGAQKGCNLRLRFYPSP
jgi:hypothetical protein